MGRGGSRPGAGRKSKTEKIMSQVMNAIASPDPRVTALLTGQVSQFPTMVRALLKLIEAGAVLDDLPEGSDSPEEGRDYFFLYPCDFRGLCARFYTKEELDVALAVMDKWLRTGERYARVLEMAKKLEADKVK